MVSPIGCTVNVVEENGSKLATVTSVDLDELECTLGYVKNAFNNNNNNNNRLEPRFVPCQRRLFASLLSRKPGFVTATINVRYIFEQWH